MQILISEVHKRSVLWNRSHCRYKDRTRADKEWAVIAKTVGMPKDDVKKKWRNLQDQFKKELKKLRKSPQDQALIYNGKWQYFKSLLFLRDRMKPSEIEENLLVPLEDSAAVCEAHIEVSSAEENDTEFSFVAAPPSNAKQPSLMRLKRKRTFEIENDVEHRLLEIERKKLALLEASEDENSLFLRSLLPFMRKLDPIRQLHIRTKFQDILLQEMEAVQNEDFK